MSTSTRTGVPPAGGRGTPGVADDDPRVRAFVRFLRSVDARDWRAGQLATRELRALGFSVVLIPKPGDRRGA